MMLPFYTHLSQATAARAGDAVRGPVLAGLHRAWRLALRAERPDLWSAMWMSLLWSTHFDNGATAGAAGNAPPTDVVDGMLWNMRTWPLELVDWPFDNAHRLDVRQRIGLTRFGRPQLERVLPANERWQDRWNGNPYVLNGGGSGMTQSDPGAWLLPYWMGRFYGLIGADE